MSWLYLVIFALLGVAIAMQWVFLRAYAGKVPAATRAIIIGNMALLGLLVVGLAALLATGRL